MLVCKGGFTFHIVLFLILFAMSISAFSQENLEQLQSQEIEEYLAEHKNINNTIATLTGTAINPLLIPGTIGAYKYYTTPNEARNLLPWFYQPWFFGICLVLATLAYIPAIPADFLNLPPAFSKFIELCNKKIGLLLASPLLFDTVTSLAKQLAETAPSAFTVDRQFVYASVVPWERLSGIPQVLLFIAIVPMLLFVFFAMWLLNYVFDVLIVLCPFGWIDLFLKILRGIFYALLLITAVYFPQLIYILVIPVAIVSILLFGWSVRRAIMGLVFLNDFIFRNKNAPVGKIGLLAFWGSKKGVKNKSIGRLTERDGDLSFSFRRYFLFRNTVAIDRSEIVVKKGFLYSTIHNNGVAVCALPPRYQNSTEEIKTYLDARIEDGALKKGLKGIWEWFTGLRSSKMAEPASV